jgi:hypothetical protein
MALCLELGNLIVFAILRALLAGVFSVPPGHAHSDLHETCVMELGALRGVAVGVSNHDLGDGASISVLLGANDFYVPIKGNCSEVGFGLLTECLGLLWSVYACQADDVLLVGGVKDLYGIAIGYGNDAAG